jgi:hypothetical protein
MNWWTSEYYEKNLLQYHFVEYISRMDRNDLHIEHLRLFNELWDTLPIHGYKIYTYNKALYKISEHQGQCKQFEELNCKYVYSTGVGLPTYIQKRRAKCIYTALPAVSLLRNLTYISVTYPTVHPTLRTDRAIVWAFPSHTATGKKSNFSPLFPHTGL